MTKLDCQFCHRPLFQDEFFGVCSSCVAEASRRFERLFRWCAKLSNRELATMVIPARLKPLESIKTTLQRAYEELTRKDRRYARH